MSQFDTNIKVLLDAQAAYTELDKLEKRVLKVKNAASQAAAFKTVRAEKTQADAQVRAAESRLDKQIRLNAALERQETLLKSIKRAGVQGDRRTRVDNLAATGKQFKDNLRVQNAVNVGIEKELQTQREINRTDRAQNKLNSENTTTTQRRIKALRAVGATEAEINTIVKTRAKLIKQNSAKQTDLARESASQVDRQLKTLERKCAARLKDFGQAANKTNKPLSSPMRA